MQFVRSSSERNATVHLSREQLNGLIMKVAILFKRFAIRWLSNNGAKREREKEIIILIQFLFNGFE